MVDGGRNRQNALQRLARWPTTSPSSSTAHRSESKKHSIPADSNFFQPIDHENLVQGLLYIMKVKIVTIGLFEGWNDDMCCFSILRSDNQSMRWSQARYLPGDFDAFDAFDEAGNPPVYLWTRYLHIQIPINWFSLFEEARRRQRMWSMDLQQQYAYQQQQDDNDDYDTTSFPAPPSTISSLPLDSAASGPMIGHPFSDIRHDPHTIHSDTNAPTSTINGGHPSSAETFDSVAQPSSVSDQYSLNQLIHDHRMVYSPTPSMQYPGTKRAAYGDSGVVSSHQYVNDKKKDPLAYLQPRDSTVI